MCQLYSKSRFEFVPQLIPPPLSGSSGRRGPWAGHALSTAHPPPPPAQLSGQLVRAPTSQARQPCDSRSRRRRHTRRRPVRTPRAHAPPCATRHAQFTCQARAAGFLDPFAANPWAVGEDLAARTSHKRAREEGELVGGAADGSSPIVEPASQAEPAPESAAAAASQQPAEAVVERGEGLPSGPAAAELAALRHELSGLAGAAQAAGQVDEACASACAPGLQALVACCCASAGGAPRAWGETRGGCSLGACARGLQPRHMHTGAAGAAVHEPQAPYPRAQVRARPSRPWGWPRRPSRH